MAIATSKENLNQTEISNLVASGVLREKLTADRTYYVDTAGSDTNDGLTPGTAFATIERSFRAAENEIDLNGFNLTISVADGTYVDSQPDFSFAPAWRLQDLVGVTADTGIRITGNTATPQNVILQIGDFNSGIEILRYSGFVEIEGFQFERKPPVAGKSVFIAVGASDYAHIFVDNCIFKDLVGATCINAFRWARAFAGGSNQLTMDVGTGSYFNYLNGRISSYIAPGVTITVPGGTTADFSDCVFKGDFNTLFSSFSGVSISGGGAVTGKEFCLFSGSSYEGSLTATFPGSLPRELDDTSNIVQFFPTEEAVDGLEFNGKIRERLTANRTYYVDPAGSDTNDGLTVGTAFLTLQKAFDTIADELDLAGFIATIEIQAGTYTDENAIFNGAVGGSNLTDSSVIITANGAVTLDQTGTSQAITILEANCAITIEDIAFTAPPAGFASSLISVISSVFVEINNCSFDNQNRSGIFVESSRVDVAGVNLTNSVAYSRFISYSKGSYGRLTGTATPTGTPNFNSEFLRVSSGSTVEHVMTGTGMTGDKINVEENSHVSTTAGFLFLPGDVDGTYDETSSFNGTHGLKFNNAIRERLTANRTYYVDPAGSDSNDGLTVGTPFATISKAVNVVSCELDIQANVTIQLADGTYNEPGIFLSNYVACEGFFPTIEGNGANPALVVIDGTGGSGNAVLTSETSQAQGWNVNNVKLQSSDGPLVRGTVNGYIQLFNIHCGVTGGVGHHFWADDQSIIKLSSATITAGATRFTYASENGQMAVTGTVTISAPVTYSQEFASCKQAGFLKFSGVTFVNPGNVTGKKFEIEDNGYIHTSTEDFNYFPGTVAGTLSATSGYDEITLHTGVNTETLAANKTITDGSDLRIQILTPSGADRDVNLPASGTLYLREYIVINPAGSGFNLLLKESAVTLSTITPGTQAAVVYDGTDWITY